MNWQKVYSTKDPMRAEMVKSILHEHDIPAIVIDKADSAYNNFGEREVYVDRTYVLKALQIIEHDIQFE